MNEIQILKLFVQVLYVFDCLFLHFFTLTGLHTLLVNSFFLHLNSLEVVVRTLTWLCLQILVGRNSDIERLDLIFDLDRFHDFPDLAGLICLIRLVHQFGIYLFYLCFILKLQNAALVVDPLNPNQLIVLKYFQKLGLRNFSKSEQINRIIAILEIFALSLHFLFTNLVVVFLQLSF